jgi:hypothetical protein
MKTMVKLVSLQALLLVLVFFATPCCLGRELIEPTRTLKSSEVSSGRISLFSEPPGLDVFLNSEKLGKTPLTSLEVKAGEHKLRIGEAETEIFIEPGESVRFSLYKGSFIEIPKEEQEEETLRKPKAKEPTTERKTVKPENQEQREYDPFSWPLNPSGPIR